MKLKTLLLSASFLSCAIASTASLAVEATPGLRIFNQNPSISYTTSTPTGCTGVTFPTPVMAHSNATIQISSHFAASGNVCSTQYTRTNSQGQQDICLVSLVSSIASVPFTSAVTMYAYPLSSDGLNSCTAINKGTAVLLS